MTAALLISLIINFWMGHQNALVPGTAARQANEVIRTFEDLRSEVERRMGIRQCTLDRSGSDMGGRTRQGFRAVKPESSHVETYF
jgi:hypothetical protein